LGKYQYSACERITSRTRRRTKESRQGMSALQDLIAFANFAIDEAAAELFRMEDELACNKATIQQMDEFQEINMAVIVTLRNERDAAYKLMQEAIENCELCRGAIECARCKSFDTFLKAQA
jgi:hypothetical protein